MKKNYIYVLILLIYNLIGLVLLYLKTVSLVYELSNCYNILIIIYFILGNLTIILCSIKKVKFFDPIMYISLLYILIFSVAPMLDIVNNNILFLNEYLWSGCIKGSIYFSMGYLAFLFGYFLKVKQNYPGKIIIHSNKNFKVKRWSGYLWLFCFLLSLFYIIRSGKDLLYIFSFGILGEGQLITDNTSLDFLSLFSYSLIPLWLLMFGYEDKFNSKLILMSVGTLAVYYMMGFRFIMLIFLGSIFVYIHLIKNKKPKILNLIVVFLILLIIIGVVEFSRNGIRTGTSVNWQSFNIKVIEKAITGNFSIYQPFYGMVTNIPSQHTYTYGSQMIIYTLIMFVPRFIWPNKPYPISQDILRHSVNDYAVKAGSAFPNIGEFYFEFGLFGIIIFMFLLGFIINYYNEKWTKSMKVSKYSIMKYSILLPTCFQIIIRGYTPSNFYLVIFLLGPIIIMERINIK